MEVFTLIARKKNVALVFVSYLLVALAAISLLTICIGFAPGILFAVVFGLIAYLMIMAQNTALPKLKTRAAESALEYTAWSL